MLDRTQEHKGMLALADHLRAAAVEACSSGPKTVSELRRDRHGLNFMVTAGGLGMDDCIRVIITVA